MNIKKTIASGIAAASLLGNAAFPLLAQETSLQITGNGALSENYATVSQTSQTNVSQNNDADVNNYVDSDANTGGNSAAFNTGDLVVVKTGDASTNVSVDNLLNSNTADVDCCAAGDTDVLINGNGALSDNVVALDQRSRVDVDQDNDADVDNYIDANAKTGNNDAGWNVGDVVVKTGDATTDVDVSTTANANVARVSGPQVTPEVSLQISGNGALSDNFINAYLSKRTDIEQDNDADVENDIDANAKTGYNDADFNTGGFVLIDTGNADTTVTVDNMVNFNAADVDCGCLWDISGKIARNGAKSDSVLDAYLASFQNYDQDNDADLDNDVDADAKTGKNDAGWNTGDVDSDPAVLTGDASTTVEIENVGNSNVIGDFSLSDLPEFEWDWDTEGMSSMLLAFLGFVAH